ncbi:winged helix-turn-helix transcriptional regulator [Sphingomonas sp. AAP5]|uniref:winged helix-turn-helix transcriptional regulator n=1 Tax=Sphingomonas sp. AAP5 TaxID=1523415 RepID=UPI001F0F4DC2|nr:winged helix-turn-helix transcriptional regulator [Sphingomonas sp. AAP5]
MTEAPSGTSKRWYGDACGTALALEFVGERWSLLVIRELLLGPRRFGEIRSGLPGLSANVLTQRLQGLEAAGVLTRETLPPPANVQVYALTPWGYEAEPIVMALGRWALRSPAHDPSLPFSRVALMLALRMMFDPAKAEGFAARIGFSLGSERYVAAIGDGGLTLARDGTAQADAVLAGEPNAFLPALFGTTPLAAVVAGGRLSVSGDVARAAHFCTLFALPPKIA